MGEDDIYTNDGTLDIHKKPAIKKKTGNWKACSFILGMIFDLFEVNLTNHIFKVDISTFNLVYTIGIIVNQLKSVTDYKICYFQIAYVASFFLFFFKF